MVVVALVLERNQFSGFKVTQACFVLCNVYCPYVLLCTVIFFRTRNP